MSRRERKEEEDSDCSHKNVTRDGAYFLCQDCGFVLDETIDFDKIKSEDYYFKESQRDYERRINPTHGNRISRQNSQCIGSLCQIREHI